jgi:hypothetical protein
MALKKRADAASQRFLEHQHQRQHQNDRDKHERHRAQRQLEPQRIFRRLGQTFAHLRFAAQD